MISNYYLPACKENGVRFMEKKTVKLKTLQREEREASIAQNQKEKAREQAMELVMRAPKWGLSDSDEYKAIKKALTDLNQCLNLELSESNVRQFQEAHKSLGTACIGYLEKNADAATNRGKHRLDLVFAVKKLYSMEKESVNHLRSKDYREKVISEGAGKNWRDYLENYRKKRASVSEEDITYHGASMSSRMEVKLEDETVFFTKKGRAEGLNQYMKSFIDNVSSDFLKKALEYEFTLSDLKMPQKRAYLQAFVKKATPVMRSECDTEMKVDQLGDCLTECMEKHRRDFSGVFFSAVGKEENRLTFFRFADGYNKKCLEELALRSLGEPRGIDLPSRNIATRRLAELLGLSDLVVNAGYMDLSVDGKLYKGVYTSKAEGIDINRPNGKRELKEAVQNDNSSFQKAVSGLQVLDAICGQVDRHVGNMLYKTEEVDGIKVLTGIEGIDNELCFGLADDLSSNRIYRMGRDEKMKFATKRGEVESVPAIDGKLAGNIMTLDRDTLDYTLGDILNGKELDCLEQRVKKVQKLVAQMEKKEQILYEDSQWTAETARQAKCHNNYYGKLAKYLEPKSEKTKVNREKCMVL